MAAEAEKLNLDNIIARLLEGIVFGFGIILMYKIL